MEKNNLKKKQQQKRNSNKKTSKRMKAVTYFKNVGLNFETPSDVAIQGNYLDKKCPFTGNISL